MENSNNAKWLGWVWVILSPLLLLMALISTVDSLTTYYVQVVCFSLVAISGFIFGIAHIFNKPIARKVLGILSWLGFIYFAGSATFGAAIALLSPVKHDANSYALLLIFFIGVFIPSIPFLLMAKKFTKLSREGNNA